MPFTFRSFLILQRPLLAHSGQRWGGLVQSTLSEERKSQPLSQQLRVNLSCGLLLNGEQVKTVFQRDDSTRNHHAQYLSRLIFLIKGRKKFLGT